MLRTLLTHLSSMAAPSRQPMATDGELVNIRRMSASTACSAKVSVQVKQDQPWQSLHPRHLSVRNENPCECRHNNYRLQSCPDNTSSCPISGSHRGQLHIARPAAAPAGQGHAQRPSRRHRAQPEQQHGARRPPKHGLQARPAGNCARHQRAQAVAQAKVQSLEGPLGRGIRMESGKTTN